MRDNKKISLRKIIPNVITLIGFCFGLTSMKLALYNEWELSVLCVIISAICDACDGRVARYLGHSSLFGAELDSLSDLVCFGVAPGFILFLKSVHAFENIGWACCLIFITCCALRLARFNALQVTTDETDSRKKLLSKNYFTGIPAPAGAILALSPLIMFFETHNEIFAHPAIISFSLIVSGMLMISTVKNFSSKMIKIPDGKAAIAIILITFLIICTITKFWLTLITMIIVYLALIPCGAKSYKIEEAKLHVGT